MARMKPFDARVLRLVPEARAPLAVLTALAVVGGLAAIGQALAVAALVVSFVQPDQGHPSLPTAAGWALALFAIRGICAGLTELVAARAAAVVSGGLREALVASLLARPADDRPDPARAVDLATQGCHTIEPYVARYLPTLLSAAVLPPAAILAMAFLDPWTALIPVLTVPLLPVFAALIGSATADATNRRRRSLAALAGHFLDVMRGLPTLVAYGRARRQRDVITAVGDENRRATVATLRLAFLSSAALELLATLSVAIVAVWVGVSLANGSMELSRALPLILLAPEAYWPIRRVGAEFHSAADGAQALDDIAGVLDETAPAQVPAQVPAQAPDAPATVRLRGVSYRHDADSPPVLDGLDVEFGRGLTVVTGPSGAGKTTLLELVAGLRRPGTGEVQAPPAHLMTQRPFLAAATLRDNLLLGAPRGRGDEELREVLRRVGLDGLLATLPDGLDTLLGDDGHGLSAGQRARIALARALLSDRPVLLLDEPTAHLDPSSEALVEEVVRDLARDRIVVAVSHRGSLDAVADARLVVEPALAGGRS